MEQVNSLLQQEIALLLSHHVPLEGGLITVTGVDCAPDIRYATIYVSVLPEKYAGTVLSQLRKKSGLFAQHLRGRIKMRRLPSFNWKLDMTESQAAELEDIFKELETTDEDRNAVSGSGRAD